MIEGLKVNVQVSWFEEHLGAAALKHRSEGLTEYVWVNRYSYVQAIANEDHQVVRWTVTVRDKRFHPRLRLPNGGGSPRVVRLGRTRFSELPSPSRVEAVIGARRWRYDEMHRAGNPGLYCTTLASVTDLGSLEGDVPVGLADPTSPFVWTNDSPPTPALEQFRRTTRFDTFGLAGPSWSKDPFANGPDLDDVRVLEI